ncbi:helix-turn-helix domain-containing protein [Phenylobacterium deserti]|uniref:helix-turn-helix domain-containing protein n=1 Tax=Phenylobacterium deserti TaxID=1914756 RepID=UPI00140337CC|nr:helix-turn-helix domain-containing protein [Phenylobacterium deserti]
MNFENDFSEQTEGAVLRAVLRFLRPQDRLVVNSLRELGASPAHVLEVLESASLKRAVIEVLGAGISTEHDGGAALKAALALVDRLGSDEPAAGRASAEDIQRLKAAGRSQKEIAALLGVSRVTVWRKLKGAPAS